MARGVRRSSGPLDARAQAILRAVIEEYVTTAVPVGSQTLVERYPFGVSAATVRNVLAELELEGFLGHPAHLGRARADRRRLPLLRGVAGRGDAAPADRAADDPPPVRAGRVRHRPVVPPRGHDARLRHAVGRAGDARQAARGAHPADRAGRHRRADGVPGRRPQRGLAQAGAAHDRPGHLRRRAGRGGGPPEPELHGAHGAPTWPSASAGSTRLRRTTPSSRSSVGRARGPCGSSASSTGPRSSSSSATACST